MFLNHVFRREWFNRFLWFLASLIKNDATLRKSYLFVGIKTLEISAYFYNRIFTKNVSNL